jgi:hypothetical protein
MFAKPFSHSMNFALLLYCWAFFVNLFFGVIMARVRPEALVRARIFEGLPEGILYDIGLFCDQPSMLEDDAKFEILKDDTS